MRPAVDERGGPSLVSLALAVVSVLMAIAMAGPYANAIVSAGGSGARRDCGTVWEPNAATSACSSALTERAWTAIGLLGASVVGVVASVLLAGSPRGERRRPLILAAAVAGVVVIAAGLIWSGVIDRTFGG